MIDPKKRCQWGCKTEAQCEKRATWKHPPPNIDFPLPPTAYGWQACDLHAIGNDNPLKMTRKAADAMFRRISKGMVDVG